MSNLFLALWPTQRVREQIEVVSGQISAESGRRHHPQDLHMTLLFLGSATAEKMASIEQVAETISFAPFALKLQQIELWQRPHLLCVTPKEGPEPLVQLVNRLRQGLAECGVKTEDRPYRSHVTLIRKVLAPISCPSECAIDWPVSHFVLATSATGPNLPRYRILKSWPADS
ncbi:MAG: RNA 2',3'-cyclic phosphodiesterase [Candidatus Polarisedimenticolaceae bacterium]|nr:RNA 2',3'-cyclic phosphodiesterase [Candidatus Polarisedimenticolaceae bacterium]